MWQSLIEMIKLHQAEIVVFICTVVGHQLVTYVADNGSGKFAKIAQALIPFVDWVEAQEQAKIPPAPPAAPQVK